MRQLLFLVIMCVLLTSIIGCKKADEALKALDKAKTVTENIDKTTKELKDKVQGIIPGLMNTEKEADGQGSEGSEDKEGED
jgi:hypothetical protein